MGKKGKGGKKPNKRTQGKPNGEKFPHFRFYLKSRHPALIVGDRPVDEYNYKKVTSSERDGNHPNEKVEPNPDKTKSTPMYIGKRTRHDKKKNFSKWKYPWKYPKK
ncbi:MAG: hypothetical protein LBL66_08375 [Clostridiales bacterium]|jgi:hypothetical protein|nr:hypothetical protein [Clostridiales bacterium]